VPPDAAPDQDLKDKGAGGRRNTTVAREKGETRAWWKGPTQLEFCFRYDHLEVYCLADFEINTTPARNKGGGNITGHSLLPGGKEGKTQGKSEQEHQQGMVIVST